MALFQETIHHTARISTEHGTFRHDHFLQLLGICRKILYPVSLFFHLFQKIIQRGNHFHSGSTHGTLSRTFIVVNHNSFLAIRLFLQSQRLLNILHVRFQPGRYRKRMTQSLFILVLGKESRRTDSPVNFRCNNTLGHKSSGHSHRVPLPFLYQAIYSQRSKQQDITFFQIFHDIISQPAMRHIDNSIRANFTHEIKQTS